ncbi:glutathione-dependent formaldehyde-activating protein [Alcanivorax xiamenensis]|uniref:Glutathione-dependent formaldehyde-activating protein n=1 Tax=Alcanivorax xiamenensis TaxID=1177156 RepID=A0ABQ6YBZ2_9GAMM|nr:GFA family protein [Alcanivorax xiamenensis]KAF0807617.1 glutathione-dependent formaldehyde-activating protein [Alcanivorax xiamenensis]
MYTGQCLCGGVRFRIEGELAPVQVCHCSQCRHAQGTPFATNIPVPTDAFHLDAGEDLLKGFESTPGKERVFCGHCGSPLFSRRADLPEVVRIRAGLINGPLDVRPAWHAFTASKADWWSINDDLPCYPEGYPGRP